MATQLGNYNDPSYLVRQQVSLGVTTAGASGTSGGKAFLSDMRIRNAIATIRTAGTSSGVGAALYLMVLGTSAPIGGTSTTTTTTTATLGTATLGTATAYSTATFGDMNTKVYQGSVLFMKNGTDASSVVDVTVECYIDPVTGAYTGPQT